MKVKVHHFNETSGTWDNVEKFTLNTETNKAIISYKGEDVEVKNISSLHVVED